MYRIQSCLLDESLHLQIAFTSFLVFVFTSPHSKTWLPVLSHLTVVIFGYLYTACPYAPHKMKTTTAVFQTLQPQWGGGQQAHGQEGWGGLNDPPPLQWLQVHSLCKDTSTPGLVT